MKIKALLISPSLYWGGAEQWMHDLIHYSQDNINWVGVVPFCNYNNDQVMVEQIKNHCPVYFFGREAIKKVISEHKPDIVVAWGDPDLSIIQDIPIVWCAHGSGGFDRHSYLVCRNYATRFAAVSKACLQVFDEEDRHKVKIIYNGVDEERVKQTISREAIRSRLGLAPTDFVIGYTGRVVLEKNLVCLANAVKTLPPQFKLCLVGAGCNYEQCKKEIQNILSKRVVFTGRVTDIGNYLRAFDCFVLPSLAEGFSLAFLEALLCKVPCLVTNVGSVPELTEKYGKLWWLLSSNPTPEEIAQLILTLYKTPKTQTKLYINAAYNLVQQQFTVQQMAKGWVDYFYSVVGVTNEW